jgi:ubiquinone/menaquinone biosynthesis C-methylase UbiE
MAGLNQRAASRGTALRPCADRAAEDDLAAAYSATGAAWQTGPSRVYDRLAESLVAASPVDLDGRLVLDVGSGTGAASRAVDAVGGSAVACDLALGMLAAAVARGHVVAAAAADARALPVRDGGVGAVVAAFSFNHLPDPARALAEAARVVAPGGAVLASAYAATDHHPAKDAVEQAAAELGWRPPAWAERLRADAIPHLATVERAGRAAEAAGLRAEVEQVDVAFADLDAHDLVAWRLGMAQLAPFVATLPPPRQDELAQRAIELLGDAPALVRQMIVVAATV